MERWPAKAVVGLPFLLVAVVLGGAPAVAARTGSGIARPLRLPSVHPGQRCPTSIGVSARTLDRAWPGMIAVGRGPVYVLAVAGAPAGRMLVSEAYRDKKGWVGQKSPWLIAPTYRGPVLIRGARVDSPGEMRFAFGAGQHLRTLSLPAHKGVQPNGWRVVPSATLVRQPGCYAYQVDGANFSRVVVIRVVLASAG